LVALKYVLDHAVAKGSVFVGHVDRCAARTIAETGDVAAEWNVLAGGLTDGGYIDFGAVDFKAPVTDLSRLLQMRRKQLGKRYWGNVAVPSSVMSIIAPPRVADTCSTPVLAV
jgi:hypothetical protein